MLLKKIGLLLVLFPLLGLCDDTSPRPDWRTLEQARNDFARSVDDMIGSYKVASVRNINIKFTEAKIFHSQGTPVISFSAEGRAPMMFGGKSCDGRYRGNGRLVILTCDVIEKNSTVPESFFSIQKLGDKKIEVRNGDAIELKPDPDDKGAYMFAYFDQPSGEHFYVMIERK